MGDPAQGRAAFARDAVLAMDADGDLGAPGAAVTTALCGHWEHPPPCPLAAHHCAAERVGGEVRLRILFATPPERLDEVVSRIDAALGAGSGPDGGSAGWEFRGASSSEVTAAEREHAARLARG